MIMFDIDIFVLFLCAHFAKKQGKCLGLNFTFSDRTNQLTLRQCQHCSNGQGGYGRKSEDNIFLKSFSGGCPRRAGLHQVEKFVPQESHQLGDGGVVLSGGDDLHTA